MHSVARQKWFILSEQCITFELLYTIVINVFGEYTVFFTRTGVVCLLINNSLQTDT